jgi:long-chain acyl-CoA synthetase
VGKARDCEVRTVDDEGCDTAAGEPGELVIRGPNVMKGYFRMPEETAAVLVDGWFHTGDVAIIDEEGFVFIVGRKKSLIISGGYNIYPEDVTHVLMGMMGIVDAVTLGMPDAIWGERVVSCVVVDPQADIGESDIAAYFLLHASPEKLPRDIHIFEEFPRGPAGKVVLSELRVLLEQRGRDVEKASAGEAEVDCRVIEIAAHVFKLPVDELQENSSPDTTSNWSSLAHVEFLMTIETAFDVKFSARDIMSIVSLGDAVEVLGRKLS